MKKRSWMMGIGVIACAALLSGCGKQDEPQIDMSSFMPPEGFAWEGTYMDDIAGNAVLTIEKDGNTYHCSIGVPTDDLSYMDSYTFDATYDKDVYSLTYTDGVHNTYEIPDYSKENPGKLISEEVYTDGTGAITYLDGDLIWTDDKEGAGSGFVFRDAGNAAQEEIPTAEDAFSEAVQAEAADTAE